jgi:murein DD-endopeptidase MepM/ murein hydrolase activator NlpD
MRFKSSHIFFFAIILISLYLSWRSYVYFFDTTKPILLISGIEDNAAYAGDLGCTAQATKKGEISVWLDDKPLIDHFYLSQKNHGHPFTIHTKTLSDGRHTLKTMFSDTSYNKNSTVLERTFYVDNSPLQAAFIRFHEQYKVFQGRTLHIQFQVNKDIKEARVSALSNSYNCYPESKNSTIYEAFIPIECEEKPSEYLFSVDIVDGVGNSMRLDNTFQVVKFPFKTQILHVDDEKVKEEQELGAARKVFEDIIAQLSEQSPAEKLWRGEFCTPIDIQRITTDFGTVRTTQHKGRYAHKALDVVNAPRTVVWACQDGRIALKDRFADSGNTVVIDHGCGILSLYFHLEDFAPISVGDTILKGNPVGTLGKTGYAKGYHLHWELRINNIPVDPLQWTQPTF